MGGWALPSKLTLSVIHPPPYLGYCLVFRAVTRHSHPALIMTLVGMLSMSALQL